MFSLFLLLFIPVLSYALPAINFTELSYDFGDARQGEKVEHEFEFSNSGDQELVIEKMTYS